MIGLIGVTGEVGKHTLSFLKSKADLCLLVRDLKKVSGLVSDNIQARKFDFTEFEENPFDGVKSLLWILSNNHQEMQFDEKRWLKLASNKGVQHIVKLSVMRVEEDDIFHHRESELNIENSGIAYTFLRPNTFMQNFNHYESGDIKYKHQLRFPAGIGKTSFIDSRDIAEVAATLLLDSNDHLNKAYTLTGGEALTYSDAASIFSDELNFTVEYIDTTQSDNLHDQHKINHPFYAAVKRGEFEAITTCVEDILDKPPRTLAQYVKDYKSCFLEE